MSPDTTTLDLAAQLIARPSITPDDADCQRLVAARLLPLGFTAEWFWCGEVTNLLLTRGFGSPSLWFLGHTDVVPTGPVEAWTSPPFSPQVRDGKLYGRGAGDMKGAVAAMVVALERFVADHPNHPGQVGLLLTSDEEGLAVDGIKRVAADLAQRGQRPDHCLVGEPSSNETLGDSVRIGRRGSMNAVLTVTGVQGHTALPERLDNPVHRLAPFITALTSLRWDEGDDDFPPSHCQVSNISAGTGAENVTPGTVRLMFNVRNGPASPEAEVKARVTRLLAEHGIERYRLDWRVNAYPFRSEPGALRAAVLDALQDELGQKPHLNTGGGTSDGRFIAPLGSEVVELGLINASIHQVDEHASVADLDKLTRVYRSVIERLLSP